MEKLQKGKRGITLISLVITIAVLIILAGVSVSVLTGDSGVIYQASKAKLETRATEVEERKELWKVEKVKYKENAPKLPDLINDLVKEGLLLESEKDIILGNEEKEINAEYAITIGTHYINFLDEEKNKDEENKDEENKDEENDDEENNIELEGSGTEQAPYLVSAIEDLQEISDVTNEELYDFSGKYISLTRNLDFNDDNSYRLSSSLEPGGLKEKLTTGMGFLPISGVEYYDNLDWENYIDYSFKGIFDGNNYTISNLYIRRDDNSEIFEYSSYVNGEKITIEEEEEIWNYYYDNDEFPAYITKFESIGISSQIGFISGNSGTVKNLTLTSNINCSGEYYVYRVGGLIAFNSGLIDNCHTDVDIYFEDEAADFGGIAGGNSGEINNCSAQGKFEKKDSYSDYDNINNNVAGIVAEMYDIGKISGCTNYIDLKNNDGPTGGIVSVNSRGKIEDCINYGDIETINSTTTLGGIAAFLRADGVIDNCINNGKITQICYEGDTCGGIVGQANGVSYITDDGDYTISKWKIKGCTNNGVINIDTQKRYLEVGGILGYGGTSDSAIIQNCTNTADIKAFTVYANDIWAGGKPFDSFVGGILGRGSTKIVMSNNINTGNISGGVTGDIYSEIF